MHLPLPRASGNKNTPATARNFLGIINRNKKRQQNQQLPQPQPLGKRTKSKNCGWGTLGPLHQLGLGAWGAAPTLGPPKGAGGCGHHRSGREVSKDGTRHPMAPFRKGTVTPSTYHSSFHECRRQPHIPPLGTGTRWGCPGPEQGNFFLSLGKIYNFCFFFFFNIYIYIYRYLYIHTPGNSEREKK